jgi:hypothetical protein
VRPAESEVIHDAHPCGCTRRVPCPAPARTAGASLGKYLSPLSRRTTNSHDGNAWSKPPGAWLDGKPTTAKIPSCRCRRSVACFIGGDWW